MKKVIEFSFEQDESEIHSEAHKIRVGKGKKLVNTVDVVAGKKYIKVKIKPKCSK